MTRATVEDSTAGLGQTLCTGRPLVGGLILPCRRGTVHEFAPPGGISGPECFETPRPMQVRVSGFWGRTTACDPPRPGWRSVW